MFKVLILAYYFPPLGLSGVQRVLKFVKYLPQFGWQPTVITCQPGTYYAFDDSLLEDLDGKNIEIHRIKGKEINSLISKKSVVEMPPEYLRKFFSFLSSIFFIPDNKKSWSKLAYHHTKKLLSEDKYDLIFVSGPPFSTFSFASQLKTEFNLPLIFDYRDLWFGNQFAIYPTPIHKYLIKRSEYAALKNSDKVIVTNRRIKEKLMDYYKFLKFSDVTILPHGYDHEDFNGIQRVYNMEPGYFHITYSGIFYEYISPRYFLEAFQHLVREQPAIAAKIKLHFVGILRKENKKLITKLNLDSYCVEHGYLQHKQAVDLLTQSQLLWFMVGTGRNSDTISSGKMFEYIGSGKPILACLQDGALKDILLDYNAATIVPSNGVIQIKQSILDLYNKFEKNTLPEGEQGFRDKYRRDNLTEVLSKEFNSVLRI